MRDVCTCHLHRGRNHYYSGNIFLRRRLQNNSGVYYKNASVKVIQITVIHHCQSNTDNGRGCQLPRGDDTYQSTEETPINTLDSDTDARLRDYTGFHTRALDKCSVWYAKQMDRIRPHDLCKQEVPFQACCYEHGTGILAMHFGTGDGQRSKRNTSCRHASRIKISTRPSH